MTDTPASPVPVPPSVPTPAGARRRRTRSWSTPATTPPATPPVTTPTAAPATAPTAAPTGPPIESFERPITERDWSRSTPTVPAMIAPQAAEAPASAEPQGVAALVTDLKADVAALRAELAEQAGARDSTLVTGTELAASIEALGTTLGTGLAALLTEHRNLLARDLEATADRILEEVAQRLRASGNMTVDAVEERVRHVSAKGLGDLGEQLDLRLDQIESDVGGLRAVMLEIPDQTLVIDRLDGVEDLTREVTALRRRIALRPDSVPAAAGASVVEEAEEELAPFEDDAPAPKPRVLAARPAARAARPPRAARTPSATKATTPKAPRTAKAAGISSKDEAPKRRAPKR